MCIVQQYININRVGIILVLQAAYVFSNKLISLQISQTRIDQITKEKRPYFFSAILGSLQAPFKAVWKLVFMHKKLRIFSSKHYGNETQQQFEARDLIKKQVINGILENIQPSDQLKHFQEVVIIPSMHPLLPCMHSKLLFPRKR